MIGDSDNTICSGLGELDIDVMTNSATVDYTDVLISGLTTAYKVPYDAVDMDKLQLAGDAKTWLEMGAYTLDCLPQKYLEAYNEVYNE